MHTHAGKDLAGMLQSGTRGSNVDAMQPTVHRLIEEVQREREKRLSMQETVNRLITELQHERERADRAEAEAFKWQESWKNEHALRLADEIGFSSLRETAERALWAMEQIAGDYVNYDEHGMKWAEVRDRLRHALDLVKGPAR